MARSELASPDAAWPNSATVFSELILFIVSLGALLPLFLLMIDTFTTGRGDLLVDSSSIYRSIYIYLCIECRRVKCYAYITSLLQDPLGSTAKHKQSESPLVLLARVSASRRRHQPALPGVWTSSAYSAWDSIICTVKNINGYRLLILWA